MSPTPAIRVLEKWLPGSTRDEREKAAFEMYGHLSEFCHPIVGAFNQYCHNDDLGGVTFMAVTYAPGTPPPIHEVWIAVVTGLTAAHDLLGVYARHPVINSQLTRILNDIADR